MKHEDIIQKIGVGLACLFTFLLPLWFLPITSDFYDFNKQILLLAFSMILLVTLGIHWVIAKQVKLLRSPLGLPSLGLIVITLLSTVFRSPNKIEALLDPAQAGTIIASILIFFSISNLVKSKKELSALISCLLTSAGLVAVSSILWGSGFIQKILPNMTVLAKSVIWSPTGTALDTLIFLGTSLILAIILLARSKSTNLVGLLTAGLIFIGVIATGLISYIIFSPNSQNQPTLLSHSTGWAIALEVLKTSPFLGSGPGSFLSDFTQFRPIKYNLSPNWAVRFTSSSNQYLQVLTLTGFVGLAVYLLWVGKLSVMIGHSFRTKDDLSIAVSGALLFLILIQLFTPLTILTMSLMFILASVLILSYKHAGISTVSESTLDIVAATTSGSFPILPWILAAIIFATVIPTGYLVGRAFAAEVMFKNSLVAASANDGKKTYDTLIATIKTNPYRDTYRVAYSQTNMLIANTLASNKNLSDADRETVTQLVQQAIREAKNAVALNPTKVTNVENLASIYRNLLNFAQGADAWTTASYQQAVGLDPINPNLRIALGGVFFAQKNYDEAVRLFQTAVDLKPDLANAHYNLATAFREKEQYERALASLEQVLNLVDKNSEDYTKASGEADELRKKVVTKEEPQAVKAPSQLTTPENSLPQPKIVPPITVSDALAPEAPSTPSGQ